MTDVIAPTAEGLARAAALLRDGAVVAFPTDTVYGVGIAATHRDRLTALFELKRRPVDRRIPMLVADLGQATDAGWDADERVHALAARFWPGALTIVMARAGGAPPEADVEATQAFRAPDHPVALALIRAAGPLYATSANISDQPDTLGADEVLIAFATDQDALAAVVDGGRVPGGVPSTVVDCSVTPARVLREGPVDRAMLRQVLDLG
jgi:L-threonylcarbamoyladenylate synthase